jgi:V/A-type H+/Na+-transporting ATPase subunit C
VPDDYGYINARVRVMHSKLLSSKLEEALSAESYGEYLRVLTETDLAPDLGDATAQGAGLNELDKALSRNFFGVAQKLAGLGDGNAGREIGLLLSKYDLLNLKAIARGKFSGRGSDEIEKSLIPAGTIKPAVLSGMAAAPDLGSLAQNLNVVGHPLANSFRTAVAQLAGDNDLLAFEVSLDQAYYSEALKRSSDTLTGYFKRDIDGANIMTALKLKAQGISSNFERYFVAGGKEVSSDRFAQIASGSGGLDGLAAFAGLSEISDLGQAESVVRTVLLKDAKRLYTSDALGVGVVIGFLKEKENEVALTRLIARGKFYGVPNETLRKEVGNGL